MSGQFSEDGINIKIGMLMRRAAWASHREEAEFIYLSALTAPPHLGRSSSFELDLTGGSDNEEVFRLWGDCFMLSGARRPVRGHIGRVAHVAPIGMKPCDRLILER